ncbi:MAG: RcpC/CpaB family pilus assembly protein [Nocardioidaceae bacterium]
MTRGPSLRRVRGAVLVHRRVLAALLAAVATVAVLRANAAPPSPRTPVLTATRDLRGGVVVRAQDVRRTPYDRALVPDGALTGPAAAVGRTTAGPLRAGEPLTDVRLVTSSLLATHPGLVAVPIRIGDPGAVSLLRVGDRVDLLATDPQSGSVATFLGRDVPVLAIPRVDQEAPGLTTGALVVVAVPDGSVARLARASVSAFLSVALTG